MGGGLGREKIELWAGQGKSSQEERITTHILAKVLIRAFTPQKYPAVKVNLNCTARKKKPPKAFFPVCAQIQGSHKVSSYFPKVNFCPQLVCKYLECR